MRLLKLKILLPNATSNCLDKIDHQTTEMLGRCQSFFNSLLKRLICIESPLINELCKVF